MNKVVNRIFNCITAFSTCAAVVLLLIGCQGCHSNCTEITITQQPQSVTVNDGEAFSLTVAASGGIINSYTWFRNGESVRAQSGNTSNYSDTASYADNGAVYTCLILNNESRSATSNGAVLTVRPVATVFETPGNLVIQAAAGSNVVFSVPVRSGSLPRSYQWQRDGLDVAGATSASYTLVGVSASDQGAQYSVVVRNPAGVVTSPAYVLTVTP